MIAKYRALNTGKDDFYDGCDIFMTSGRKPTENILTGNRSISLRNCVGKKSRFPSLPFAQKCFDL